MIQKEFLCSCDTQSDFLEESHQENSFKRSNRPLSQELLRELILLHNNNVPKQMKLEIHFYNRMIQTMPHSPQ